MLDDEVLGVLSDRDDAALVVRLERPSVKMGLVAWVGRARLGDEEGPQAGLRGERATFFEADNEFSAFCEVRGESILDSRNKRICSEHISQKPNMSIGIVNIDIWMIISYLFNYYCHIISYLI